MITLAVLVLGAFSFGRLAVDLLPHITYPEIRVRVVDPGVPARIMEDRVTRFLEEQLAVTEDAVSVQSTTTEGNSAVDLIFEYGKDMDNALRDASARLDRTKRFLPDTIDPPTIFKSDPAQLPVVEYIISSALRNPVELRTWVDDIFAKWFLNLPGVATTEAGGGLVREIQVLPDQRRLAALGLSAGDLATVLQQANRDEPAGRLQMARQELSGRTAGRFTSVEQIAALPLMLPNGGTVRLGEVAEVLDTHQDERIRARLNGIPGAKLSIHKQPAANTVAVADAVAERLDWLRAQKLIPEDIQIHKVGDEAVYVRTALGNAMDAALMGAALAMLVVYLFLGDLRRTLLIGSAIPIAAVVTFLFMDLGGLTLNIMSLGGLAIGIGMLVDNTIVMLENIQRHQQEGQDPIRAGHVAAAEVTSAIVASTSTNLAAILPFLFISGLIGLLFKELIFTISAAIFASMLVALTLVPSLAAKIRTAESSRLRRRIDAVMGRLQNGYGRVVAWLLRRPLLQVAVVLLFLGGLAVSAPVFFGGKQVFLPSMDDGRIFASITADPGVSLDEMDAGVTRVERIIRRQPETDTVFSTVGGRIYGRARRETSNKSSITVQLRPLDERSVSSEDWIRRVNREITDAQLAGMKVYLRTGGIRGIRVGSGDDSVSLRVQGPDLDTLTRIGDEIVGRLHGVPGLRNASHSYEESLGELAVAVDRERAAALGLTVEDIGQALRIALDGIIVTEFFDGDRSYDIRVRLPRTDAADLQALEGLMIFGGNNREPIYLGDTAKVQLVASPGEIRRDNQRRIVEVSASVAADRALDEVMAHVAQRLEDLKLPEGYTLYDAGAAKALREGRSMSQVLLGLALFLVFVVMAVQYESLRNPFIILLGVPFGATGVAIGIVLAGLPLSMPAWLGMIMLAGIVVNNAIVLVEYIEIARRQGMQVRDAIAEAARLRLRPILMTSLTTILGLIPLALGMGEGAEMLQPLAVAIVAGLSFSLLVSLVLIPVLYNAAAAGEERLAARRQLHVRQKP